MTVNNVMTPREVAELWGVDKSTVHRWIEADLFDVEPTRIPSPSGQRDRILFDRAAVMAQFQKEQKS